MRLGLVDEGTEAGELLGRDLFALDERGKQLVDRAVEDAVDELVGLAGLHVVLGDQGPAAVAGLHALDGSLGDAAGYERVGGAALVVHGLGQLVDHGAGRHLSLAPEYVHHLELRVEQLDGHGAGASLDCAPASLLE